MISHSFSSEEYVGQGIYGSKYSRMAKVKFEEESL